LETSGSRKITLAEALETTRFEVYQGYLEHEVDRR
jgi:hypothetical protein